MLKNVVEYLPHFFSRDDVANRALYEQDKCAQFLIEKNFQKGVDK